MKDLDHDSLTGVLQAMDDAAQEPIRLCVIGAAAMLLMGQQARRQAPVEVWLPGSQIPDAELRRLTVAGGLACEAAGPRPQITRLHLLSPGNVSLPGVEDDIWSTGEESWDRLWGGNHVAVCCPPPAILAAARLVQASEADIDDLVYLVGSRALAKDQILAAANGFPEPEREMIRRNADVLEAVFPRVDARSKWVTAVDLLQSYVHDDHALARALREGRWSELAAAVDLANRHLDDRLALTDPLLYRSLRDSITKFHARGYGCLDAGRLRQRAGRDDAATGG